MYSGEFSPSVTTDDCTPAGMFGPRGNDPLLTAIKRGKSPYRVKNVTNQLVRPDPVVLLTSTEPTDGIVSRASLRSAPEASNLIGDDCSTPVPPRGRTSKVT